MDDVRLSTWQDGGSESIGAGGCRLEPLEDRLLLAATVVSNIPDMQVVSNHPAYSVSVSSYFSDPALPGTLVEIDTVMGAIPVILYDLSDGTHSAAPLTVTNFLHYVNGDTGYGTYDNSIVHRSDPGSVNITLPVDQRNGFVIQGGGYHFNNGLWGYVNPSSSPQTVQNEFSSTRPNERGTIAMAMVGSDINSATDQWFINLGDNSAWLGSKSFTVFGRVIGDGMDVVDAISALPIYNFSSIYSALTQLPLRGSSSVATSSSIVGITTVRIVADKLTYQVSTDSPDLLEVGVDGSSILVNPVPNQTGSGHVTVTAIAFDGSTIVNTFLVTVGSADQPPVVGSLTGSPNPVVRDVQSLLLTAGGVTDPVGTVTSVEFWLDSNNNGQLDPLGDTLLGSDSSATGGWTLTISTTGMAYGDRKFFARAIDDTGNGSSPASATVSVVTAPPTISATTYYLTDTRKASWSFTYASLKSNSSAADVNGDTIKLRVEEVLSGTLTINGSPVVPGVTLLESGSTVGWTPPDATHFLYDAFTLKAYDGTEVSTGTFTVSVRVDQVPTITMARSLPGNLTMPGAEMALLATVRDSDNAVASVRFYYDSDGDGELNTSTDANLGPAAFSDGRWILELSGTVTADFAPGTARFFVRAVDSLGGESSTEFTARINVPPAIANLSTTDPPYRGDRMVLTATGVQDTAPGRIRRVAFYLDSNTNGVVDSADRYLGSAYSNTTTYVLGISTLNLPLGTFQFLAQAIDTSGGTAVAAATATIRNSPPTVTGVTSNRITVPRGTPILLTASGAADRDGSVAKVEFWSQAAAGAFNVASATKIGEDTSATGGYTLSYTMPFTASTGSLQIFARAVDNNGLAGAAVGTTLTIT
jgi:cyclophilin family peptidyl-prolyl cis-trans isomerase